MNIKRAFVILALLGACTSTAPQPREESASVPGWSAPNSYRFELKSSCGERNLIGRFRVVVTDGQTEARALDERARAFMSYEDDFGGVPNLEDLLEEAELARSDGADIVEIQRDPSDGHPTSIEIDHNEQAIDDEACYLISQYVEK